MRLRHLGGTFIVLTFLSALLIPDSEGNTHSWQYVSTLEFSPDGQTLLAGMWNGRTVNPYIPDPKFLIQDVCQTVVLLNTNDGATLSTVDQWRIHDRRTAALKGYFGSFAAFADGGKSVIVGRWDGDLIVSDLQTNSGRVLSRDRDLRWTSALQLSPTGKELVVSDRGAIWVVPLERNKVLRYVTHSEFQSPFAYSPDGNVLATGDFTGVVLWAVDHPPPTALQVCGTGEDCNIIALSFSPDGHTLAIARRDSVMLWDVESASVRHQVLEPWVDQIAFSPDGATFATAGKDSPKLWRTADGTRVNEIQAGYSHPVSVAFSPEGGLLAVGDRSGYVTVYDAVSGDVHWSTRIHGIPSYYVPHKLKFFLFGVAIVATCFVLFTARREQRGGGI